MIVTNSAVTMASRYEATQVSYLEERVTWQGAAPAPVPATPAQPESGSPARLVDLSAAGSLLARHKISQSLDFSREADSKARLNLEILRATLRQILGRDVTIRMPEVQEQAEPVTLETPVPAVQAQAQVRAPAGRLVYERTVIQHQSEAVSFAAKGVVNTADGRTIDFDISLSMAREFTRVTHSSTNVFSAGTHQMVDPIVINFDGKGAELSSNSIHFDLDMDGTPDQISQLKSGSGYLVWDKNGDGEVNDGSELFGPTSGRGFSELAAHDLDGNGFIDEADPIFSQLRIWVQHDDGSSQLLALGEKDVGAIFVGHVSTPFNYTDASGEVLGQAAHTGIYLKESGGVGLVQEVYLTKQE